MGNALSTVEAKQLSRRERMCQAQSAGAESSRAGMAEPRKLRAQASSLSDCSRFGKAERQKKCACPVPRLLSLPAIARVLLGNSLRHSLVIVYGWRHDPDLN